MDVGNTASNRRAITLQCGIFRETTIFEDQDFSVFRELVYFFLDNKVKYWYKFW